MIQSSKEIKALFGLSLTPDNLHHSLKQKKKQTEDKIVKNHDVFFNPEQSKVDHIFLLFWTNFLCFQKKIISFSSFVCSQSPANPAEEMMIGSEKRDSRFIKQQKIKVF